MSDSSRQTDTLASNKRKDTPPTSDNSQNRKSAMQYPVKDNNCLLYTSDAADE